MAVTDWHVSTIEGRRWLIIGLSQFRIPLDWDPSSGFFFAVALPNGGMANMPAMVKGDPGPSPTFSEDIDLTALDPADPTPDFATLTVLTPATEIAGPVYKLGLGLHKGLKGDPGTSQLGINDYPGSPLPGKFLVVNDEIDGFIYQTQKVGDWYIPAALNSTEDPTNAFTNGVISMGPFDYAWRPTVDAQTIVTPDGPNMRADLIARINGETDGNEVGRGFGISGAGAERINITSGPPPGSADDYDKVPAGASATIHLRTERQSGSDNFTVSASTTRYRVKADPVP